jgi:hypothetical protein
MFGSSVHHAGVSIAPPTHAGGHAPTRPRIDSWSAALHSAATAVGFHTWPLAAGAGSSARSATDGGIVARAAASAPHRGSPVVNVLSPATMPAAATAAPERSASGVAPAVAADVVTGGLPSAAGVRLGTFQTVSAGTRRGSTASVFSVPNEEHGRGRKTAHSAGISAAYEAVDAQTFAPAFTKDNEGGDGAGADRSHSRSLLRYVAVAPHGPAVSHSSTLSTLIAPLVLLHAQMCTRPCHCQRRSKQILWSSITCTAPCRRRL